ncbi:chromosome partitioning protein [Sinobacterium caligoides]|uniref:Chromosome partitioning protein n=1 Tax=Sinobacterium caligoides TaxID=933926 RepID=A0A3N2DK40_9GAMM|nr:AAA family ATPase [Sinobacterium caligoides]ROS00173.1 chromosome partitioning protein [Sinobacterium caligoides]
MSKSKKNTLKNTAEMFKSFAQVGIDELTETRQRILGANLFRMPRTWRLKEAAEILAITEDELREIVAGSATKSFSLDQLNAIRDHLGTGFKRPRKSRAHVVAIQNFKGGVGKSITTVNLAQYAAIKGLKILVWDLDPQASTTLNLGNLVPDSELSLEDVPVNAILNDPSDLPIRRSYFPGVDLMPSNGMMQELEQDLLLPEVNNEKSLGNWATRLRNITETLRDDYDLIIFDCPPNMGCLTTNAIIAANVLLSPVPPRSLDRASFTMLCLSLGSLFETLGSNLDMFKIIPTQHDGKPESQIQEIRMREMYGAFVTENAVMSSSAIETASKNFSSIYERAPRGRKPTYDRALLACNAVNEELLQEMFKLWGVK